MPLSERIFIPFNLLYFQVNKVRREYLGDRKAKRQMREIKGVSFYRKGKFYQENKTARNDHRRRSVRNP